MEIGKHGITLEWLPPRNDGGAPVRGYVIERRQGYDSQFMPIMKGIVLDTWYRDTNVFSGNDYEYRIAAENEAGVGPFSMGTGPVVARDPFGKFVLSHELPFTTFVLCN